MKDKNGFVKFILGSTPDYGYCASHAPCFTQVNSIVIDCILAEILKRK